MGLELYRDESYDDINYVASPVAREFHASEAFIRTIIGPIGSGKSVACCIEIMKKAMEPLKQTEQTLSIFLVT